MSGATLGFGIVGCGVIGPTHAAAIASLPDAQLVAVADVDEARARVLAEKYGATPYTDLQTMLDRDDLDIVNVCTPSGLHGEHACAAMRSGRHVVVEKPMEITLPAIKEMLRAQKAAGVKLAVISQHRFDEASQHVHRLVAEGAFGRLVLGSAHVPWWRAQAYYDSGTWRGSWALDDGGVLMNQSIHSIDILQWLMGPVRSVYAYTGTLVHSMETEDVAVAVLRFASGALGTIAATTGAYPGVTTRIDVLGDKGSAIIEDDRLGFLHLARDDRDEVGAYGKGAQDRRGIVGTAPTDQEALGAATPDPVGASGGRGTAADPGALQASVHALQIADMMRAIRENGTPLVDGEAGRRPVETILAIYESARTGREAAAP